MAHYQFTRKQLIKADVQQVWDFIAHPANLQKITPDHLGFNITSHVPMQIYPGLIICYTVKPILGIRTPWVTEITQVREGEFFIDEQRVGPYVLWHHQHMIKQVGDQVEMTDIMTYVPPFKWLGRLANGLFIKRKLNQIFDYRTDVINRVFGGES